MGGLKDEDITPSKSNINFLVPNVAILQAELQLEESCQKPGIIYGNIDCYSKLQGVEEKLHKISFDGKNIAQGFGRKLGEVDLYGHEMAPTLTEKKE